MSYLSNLKRPTVLSILDDALEPLGVVSTYASLVIHPSFFGVGSFEFTSSLTHDLNALAQENRLVVFGNSGAVGIIEGVSKAISSASNQIRIYGLMLDGLMRRRVVIPSDDPDLLGWDVAEGTVGAIMAHYVNDHAIAPVNPARAIPLLQLAPGIENVGMSTVTKARFDLLSDVLTSLAQYASVGWRIAIENDAFVFHALAPVDRTSSGENPLILSTAFKNISAADHGIDKTDYANTVYALGEGQYENRLYQVYYPEDEPVSGWSRFETVADCGNEDSVARLKALAMQKIADLERTDSLTLQLIGNAAQVDLGDLVTVYLPEVDATFDLLITELNVRWQGAQKQVDLTLGKPPRTLTSQLQRARRLQNIT